MVDALSTDEAASGEAPPQEESRWRSAALGLAQQSGFWILIVLVGLVVFFSLATPSGTFFSVFNLQTLLGDASGVLILAIGALLVIVAGGIDLSTGSVMTLGAVVGYLTMKAIGSSVDSAGQTVWDQGWFAIAIGMGVGVAAAAGWGVVNGLLVAYVRIPPFVVTLGSLGAALGASRLLLQGGAFASVGPQEFTDTLGISLVLGVPTPFLIAAGLAIFFGLLLAFTRLGEHLYLVGSNEEGARRAGIAVKHTHVKVYLLSGAIAGIAGLVDFARFNTVDIATGHTQSLIASIAAVIIGGASLQGGVGAMPGTVVAVFIPVVLNNGLIIMGTQPFWQDIAVGAILVAAVGFDQWRRNAASRSPGRGLARFGLARR
jgi:ribose transport system permease protein